MNRGNVDVYKWTEIDRLTYRTRKKERKKERNSRRKEGRKEGREEGRKEGNSERIANQVEISQTYTRKTRKRKDELKRKWGKNEKFNEWKTADKKKSK